MNTMPPNHIHWEMVIGLEIHVQLNTKSKLFSSAPNRFGDEPNTNISVVCTGQPGSLPVLNKEAVKKAVQFGCAINAEVSKFSKFDRKSYFYPDSPRNFQITQFEHPILKGGQVTAEVGDTTKTFHINRAHLEDDAGMLKHFTHFAGIDYNRAGAPLLEIVSEPEIYSAKEASAYVSAIKSIMEYIDASDCNMEEGSLRIDVNVSVKRVGEKHLRPKCEIKNMNSLSNMELAIASEVKRQIDLYEKFPDQKPEDVISSSTFRFDPETNTTVLMRSKEDAEDYRYFPEPDLVPLILKEEEINAIRKTLPELPIARKKRYIEVLGLSPYNATLLTSDKQLADYFEEGLKYTPNARSLCNWITVEFAGRLKESGKYLPKTKITAQNVAALVNCIESGKINGKIAKLVADEMVQVEGKSCEEIIKENPDYTPVNDESLIESIVDQVLAQNEQSILDYKAGRMRAFDFLVGQVMKATKGKASPDLVNSLIKKKLS